MDYSTPVIVFMILGLLAGPIMMYIIFGCFKACCEPKRPPSHVMVEQDFLSSQEEMYPTMDEYASQFVWGGKCKVSLNNKINTFGKLVV